MSSKREGVPGVKLPSVSSQKAASGGGERRPTGEFSVAWEDSVDSHELEENADSGIPMELWNKVVSRHVPGPNPRLGGSMRNRSPMLNGSISRNSGSSRTRRDNLGDDVYKQLETLRPKSVPLGGGVPLGLQSRGQTDSREAALLLVKKFEDLQQKIRESLGGYDPDKVARDAAEEGDADSLMEVLEATIVGVDMVLSEVVKQVQLACLERAELIDRCRKHFLAMFAHMATALFTSQAQLRGVHERGEGLEVTIGPLREEHKLAVQKIAALELELKSANERMVAMEAELDNTKRSVAKTREIEERSRSKKELILSDSLEESLEINSLLKSKVAVLEMHMAQAERNNGLFQVQIVELQDRVRRDAEKLEISLETVSRHKITAAWMRCLALAKRLKVTRNISTQDGPGLDGSHEEDLLMPGTEVAVRHVNKEPVKEPPQNIGRADSSENVVARTESFEEAASKDGSVQGAHTLSDPPEQRRPSRASSGEVINRTSNAEPVQQAAPKFVPPAAAAQGRVGGERDGEIVFRSFWASLVRQAQLVDLERFPELCLSLKRMLEFIARIYTDKILVDELDDRGHTPRQSLPEFLYDFHLELLGDPILAQEACINVVANVKRYSQQSPRARMFARFLLLDPAHPLNLDNLNTFLLALVKIQKGMLPILPNHDYLNVEASRGSKVVEYIFSQAPYIIKAKVMIGAEKRAVSKLVDLDSFLVFLVETYKEEQTRGEERLRALFVAADTDGDGNLQFEEFQNMVTSIRSKRTHREMLRMYSEMTLNRAVDANVFTRVCRKWKFSGFEMGPAVKRSDKSNFEVFDLLNVQWGKIEDMVHELLVVLDGTPIAMRMEQNVNVLKIMLEEKLQAEQTWILYRKVVAEFTSAVKNRTPKDSVGAVQGAGPSKAKVSEERIPSAGLAIPSGQTSRAASANSSGMPARRGGVSPAVAI